MSRWSSRDSATRVSSGNSRCTSKLSAMFGAEESPRTTPRQTLPLKLLQHWACHYSLLAFYLLTMSEMYSAYLCIPNWWQSPCGIEQMMNEWVQPRGTDSEERWWWFWNHDIWAQSEGTHACWSWRRIKRRGISAATKYMEDFMGEEGSVLLHMDQWVEISETGLEHPETPSFPSSPISLDHNS